MKDDTQEYNDFKPLQAMKEGINLDETNLRKLINSFKDSFQDKRVNIVKHYFRNLWWFW